MFASFLIEILLLSQIEAHYGSVNDLAFSKPNNQLLIVTCGEDKLIQVCYMMNELTLKFGVHGEKVES